MLLAETTHELANALTAISFIARKAMDSGNVTGALAGILDVCTDAIDAVRHLQPSPGDVRVAEVDVAITHVVAALLPMAETKGVSLSLDVPPGLSTSCAPAALRAIVWNLTKNAIEALEVEGRVHVSAYGDPREVSIVIADDGRGMSADELAFALEPFATSRKDGMGLGLPIVRRVVEENGGAVVFDSAPGKGTRVRITLPTNPTAKRVSSLVGRGPDLGAKAPTTRARPRRG